ncbi:MAG: biosynthetic-type acetolactate synthase large subunit [Clostridiales bacterium]|jgi:acetolactate synthase-1/2/3 large subunit|nr:biosynthetic-type acetolactate synthase large subunit [Clostridiales bacterium]
MLLNGSEILLECLLEQGVDSVFGFPGGAVLNIYDALYKYRGKINHYLTSHEQGASHAADGYARSTGKVGVCLATSGPGATNLVTGIATAYMDSVPIVAITGNVSLNLLGKDSFQEVDITGITMPITKHNFIVKDIAELADTVRRAFYIAKEGRPGPVLIDIPKDITATMYEYTKAEPSAISRSVKTISKKNTAKAAELIKESKRPFIYAGGGVITSGASEGLLKLVEKIDSPIGLSTMGLGGLPTDNPYYTGMIGMHGSKASNVGITECDLLIAVGARFSDRVVSNVSKFAPNSKVVHIDIDAAEIDKNVITYTSIVGDVKEVLERLIDSVGQLKHTEWVQYINSVKAKYPVSYKDDGSLKPQYILQKISELTNNEAIVVTDVGQHQMWACQFINHQHPRSFLTSGGLGTMGFGFGAAIGAKVGNPEKTVFNITGDGCFRMNNIELATAVEYSLPVITVIMNNHSLGMVRQWQNFFYDRRFSHTDLNRTTDFIALAKAYKAEAFNIKNKEEAEPILKQALACKRPCIINCEISNEENVLPMVPSGAGIDEMLLEG